MNRNIGLRGVARVLRRGVDAHHVARLELEILQRERGPAVGRLGALVGQQRHRFFRRAVHRIMQIQALQREIVLPGERRW